jgi:polyphosphate kinase
VIGRFLEHERVFVFGPEGKQSFFLSSADWMPRNLYRRVEVMFPVESEKLREQIRHEVIEPLRADRGCAYELGADGDYRKRPLPEGKTHRRYQAEVMDRVQHRGSSPPDGNGV